MTKLIVFLVALLFILAVIFGSGLLMTNIIIWLSNGLFSYDLSDKFWYVFVAYFVISGLLSSRITVNKN